MSTIAVSREVDERAWWKEHPDPKVTTSEDRIVLWNYPVAGTKLADEHAAALRSFLSRFALSLSPATRASDLLAITGHASSTGEASANETLAQARAENVAKYLRSLGFMNLEITAAGSAQAAEPSYTGQGLARNRRVEVTIYLPTIEPPPRVGIEPSQPQPPPAAAPKAEPPDLSGVALFFEGSGEIPLPELDDGRINAKFFLIYKVKVKGKAGQTKNAEGLVWKDGRFTAKFEKALTDTVQAKVGIDPGDGERRPSIKIGAAGQVWEFPVEIGFQTKLNFLYATVTLGTQHLPDLKIDDVTVSLEGSFQVRVEWGPSPTYLAKLAAERAAASAAAAEAGEGVAAAAGIGGAGAAATTGVVLAGSVGVIFAINYGVIYFVESAKEKGAELVVDVAMRDGAASRVAFEALGADAYTRNVFYSHRNDLQRAGGEPSREAFENGQKKVEDYLDGLEGKKAEKIKAWADKYAKDRNATYFGDIVKEILPELDAFKNEPRPLETLIPAL